MRTTLTLDPDVAAEIERRRNESGRGLKDEVNHLIRLGLLHEERLDRAAPEQITWPTFDTGGSLVGSLDNVAEVLSRGEGEAFR